MATTGQIVFTAAETVNESPWLDEAWVNPTNALQDNGTAAQVTAATFDAGDQTAVLKCYDASTALAAAIPTTATSIDGVIIRVNAWSDGATGRQLDLVQLLSTARAKGGTNQAGPTTITTDTGVTYTFGSSTDKWALALDRAWVIDPDFGVALGVITGNANSEAYIDYVTVEVFYTAPNTYTKAGFGRESAT